MSCHFKLRHERWEFYFETGPRTDFSLTGIVPAYGETRLQWVILVSTVRVGSRHTSFTRQCLDLGYIWVNSNIQLISALHLAFYGQG